jgi:hypothetical protein
MDFDLRLPIGGLFTIYGVLIGTYGWLGDKSIYAKSLGFDINLFWGGVMLVFGLVLLGFASKKKPEGAKVVLTAPPQGSGDEVTDDTARQVVTPRK